MKRDAQENPEIDYKVRGILNKITPEKFDKLSQELLDFGLESQEVLKRVLLLIFNKALDDYKYSCMYAKLCKVINDNLQPYYEQIKGKNIFKNLLLTKCKEEFHNRKNALDLYENQDGPLSINEEEKRSIAKQKMLNNIKFICELGKQQLLTESILHDCIKELLFRGRRQLIKDKAQDLECLCEIMKNIGCFLEANGQCQSHLNQYFERMMLYSNNPEINSRIRFMLLDVIDLRKNNWVPRQRVPLNRTVSEAKSERDNCILSPYNSNFYQFRSDNTNPRIDDVFSQYNIGPYYLGTGPGAINDLNHLPINNPRRNNYQKNLPYSSNYSNVNNIMKRETPTNINNRQNFNNNNNMFYPSSGGGSVSNGLNQANFRDQANLPPRFQKQLKTQNNLGFNPFMKNNNDNDRIDKPNILNKSNDRNNSKNLQNFPKSFNKFANQNNRQQQNGKEQSLANEMNKIELVDQIVENESHQHKTNDLFFELENSLSKYFVTENLQQLIKDFQLIEISFDESLLLIMRISIGKSEKERELANSFINKIRADSIVNETTFLLSLKNLFCKINELEVETPRARSYVAGFVANAITENVVSLKNIADLLEGGQHYPLFPLILQNLQKAKGQTWLLETFSDSKINLINMLPENDRYKERMADILEDRNLTFLYPMLRIESDITKQIMSDCSPVSLYRWLKDNVNVNLQSSSEFISVVFTALLKHIILKHNNPENLNVFTNQLFVNQENELKKYSQMLQIFLSEKHDLQLVVLYCLQTYCFDLNFPKGLIEKWFNMLYEYEIVDEEVFFKWREDINDDYPGKGKALFQVNKWLTWLEEDEEEE